MEKEGEKKKKTHTSFPFPDPCSPSGDNVGCSILSFSYALFLSSLGIVHINTSYDFSYKEHAKCSSPPRCLWSSNGSLLDTSFSKVQGHVGRPWPHLLPLHFLHHLLHTHMFPAALSLPDMCSVCLDCSSLCLQVTHSFIFSMSLLRHNFLNNPSGFLPWCSACLMHKDPLHISECMGNAKPGPLVQHLSQKAAACLLLIQHMDGSYARIAYIRTVCCEWLRRVWLFANPVDCSPPGSSVHGILQARKQEQVAASFSRGSSRPRVWTQGSCVVGRAVCPFKIPLWPWVSSLNLALGRSLHLPRRGWDSQVVDFAAQKPLMPVLL